jgi:hypothetical protein
VNDQKVRAPGNNERPAINNIETLINWRTNIMRSLSTAKLSAAKQTALLKRYIKQRFNISVKVKKEWYSGGNSLTISYDLGCNPKCLYDLVKRLQYGTFDGMNDIYENNDKSLVGLNINNEQLDTFKYVFVYREIPERIMFEIAKAISKNIKFEGVHECLTIDDYRRDFSARIDGFWSWAHIARGNADKLNFVTQNSGDIKIIDISRDRRHGYLSEYHFVYEVDGKQYDTSSFEENKQTEIKKASRAETNNLRMVNYSDKAIAVYGNTYEIRHALKRIGGRFNRNLREGAGWVFPKCDADEVANVIINYHETTI